MTTPTPQGDAKDLLEFIAAGPSPYHAAAEAVRRLEAAGFSRWDERDAWRVEPGARGYVVRGGATVLAFILGTSAPAERGFALIGAHVDSPNLRVKPCPELQQSGHHQLGVEVYGGALLSTWLDRDLSLAGRVQLGSGRTRLVRLERPIARISNLAIHLNRGVNTDGLVLNPQRHLTPSVGLELAGPASLTQLLEGALGPALDAPITSWDLCLYDTQPPALGGAHEELLYAPRLDNLGSSHAALRALLGGDAATPHGRVVVLYDHEEIGSQSMAGAKSRFVLGVLERLAHGYAGAGSDAAARALARSFMVSADMAHAQHPNYADKHDPQHAPRLGGGPVLKLNVNQSYATDSVSHAVFREACESASASLQHFVSRNDQPCGSTIGPISAAMMGVRTVDVGNPMLSMHSCRECAASADVTPMIGALGAVLSLPELPPPQL